MRGWNRKRAAGGVLGLVAAVLTAWGVSASAQLPGEPRPFPLMQPAEGDPLPPLMVDDPSIEPAQFTRPVSAVPPAALRGVADPPSPLVRIQVRVPADSPPGDDIKYVLTVVNTSQADAHQVVVRNPIPEGTTPVKAEPKWDEKLTDSRQLFWVLGTLKPGQSKNIELWLKPNAGVSEVKNLAYVRFEHGQAVTTRINQPAVKVTKNAPKQSIRDEPYTVRVVVENSGRVPAENVRITETIDRSANVQAITTGAKRTKSDENQWVWEIPRLLPGERRVIEYQVTPRQAKESLTITAVDAAKNVQQKAETRTQVLVPGLSVKLTGPDGVVSAGETARYEIVVRNTGTLPSTNLRVAGTLPTDCKLTMKTEGGQVYRDQIIWMIPRLEPGEAQSFRFAVRASSSGQREIAATVQDARKTQATDRRTTLFEGTAALVWETIPNPAALSVGRQGTITVRVKNNGGEPARNVRVDVELPEAVSFVQATPNVRPSGRVVTFLGETIPAYREAEFTITYEARQSAQAWFKLKLSSDALGDQPLQTEKAVEITGSR